SLPEGRGTHGPHRKRGKQARPQEARALGTSRVSCHATGASAFGCEGSIRAKSVLIVGIRGHLWSLVHRSHGVRVPLLLGEFIGDLRHVEYEFLRLAVALHGHAHLVRTT